MKILYLVSRVPYPVNKGDKLRANSQLMLLSKNHKIILFALNDALDNAPMDNKLKEICEEIYFLPISKVQILINIFRGLFSPLPFQVSFFYSPNIRNKIQEIIKKNKPDIIFCQLIRMAEYVWDIKYIPKIIDYVDAISFGLEQRIIQSGIIMKMLLRFEKRRVVKYEKKISQHFEGQVIITNRDKDALNSLNSDLIKVIPNYVDTDYFKSSVIPKDIDLLFVGNMSYPPNEDAVMFIIKEILPSINKLGFKLKLLIAGSSPTRSLLKYNSDQVNVCGWLDDIRIAYNRSKIFIAPIRFGSGLQNKLLQALAMGLPSITSKLSFEGLKKGAEEIILRAETPEDYINKINYLLTDKVVYNLLKEKGKQYIETNYSVDVIGNDFEDLISSLKH